MIAYFDTSALIPLIIEEPTSIACNRLWNESDSIVSSHLLYVEARAALSRANRMNRLTDVSLRSAFDLLDELHAEITYVQITELLVQSAGQLAQEYGLRGYDAVHLAATLVVDDPDLIFVTGDRDLADAASRAGLAITSLRT